VKNVIYDYFCSLTMEVFQNPKYHEKLNPVRLGSKTVAAEQSQFCYSLKAN